MSEQLIQFLITFALAFAVFHVAMGLSAICTWIERKGSALIQDRVGANRAGAYIDPPLINTDWALFKPMAFVANNFVIRPAWVGVRIAGVLGLINTLVCDAVKAILKEDFVPTGTSRFIHSLGPIAAALPVFLAFAVVPVAPDFEVAGYLIRPQVAQLGVGVLFILAMGSLAVYGAAIAGWCGNNKYSLLGGLRAAAQMISYELPMGIVFVTVILFYGTLDLYAMVEEQATFWQWGIFTQPLSFILLFIVGMAETKRAPFDLPESESELVAGYFTEYSGMKFLLFWMAEFTEIGLFSLILSLIFFGGWYIPFVQLPENVWWAALIGHLVLMTKVLFFCVLQIVIRWTLPRFRYDQLMSLGWKVLLPLSLINLVVYGALKAGGVI